MFLIVNKTLLKNLFIITNKLSKSFIVNENAIMKFIIIILDKILDLSIKSKLL